jgi:hypothetical protein
MVGLGSKESSRFAVTDFHQPAAVRLSSAPSSASSACLSTENQPSVAGAQAQHMWQINHGIRVANSI